MPVPTTHDQIVSATKNARAEDAKSLDKADELLCFLLAVTLDQQRVLLDKVEQLAFVGGFYFDQDNMIKKKP